MRPDITVVVPIYNVEKYVAKCLESLLKQTYKNFVIWAVSDGSPDNSEDIVKKYSLKDSRVKLITKENGGYGSVLEYAIQNIQTDYFIVCDPDDWLADDALEILHKAAEKDNLDIVVADKYQVYNESEKRDLIRTFPDWSCVKNNVLYCGADVNRFVLGEVSPHAKMFKTAILRNVKFPHHVSYTDNVLFIVGITNATRAMYLNIPLAYYLIDRPGNTMTTYNQKAIDDRIKVWYSVYNQIKNKLINSLELNLILYILFRNILRESKNVKIKKFNSELIDILNILQKNRREILLASKNKSLKSKIFIRVILTKNLGKIIINTLY